MMCAKKFVEFIKAFINKALLRFHRPRVYLKSTFFRLCAKLRFFATTNRTLDAKKKIEQRANLVQREAESF